MALYEELKKHLDANREISLRRTPWGLQIDIQCYDSDCRRQGLAVSGQIRPGPDEELELFNMLTRLGYMLYKRDRDLAAALQERASNDPDAPPTIMCATEEDAQRLRRMVTDPGPRVGPKQS